MISENEKENEVLVLKIKLRIKNLKAINVKIQIKPNILGYK